MQTVDLLSASRRPSGRARASGGATLAPFAAAALVAVAVATVEAGGALAAEDEPPISISAPLASPRNSFFYAPLGVPLMCAARTLEPGTLSAKLRSSMTHSVESGAAEGQPNRFDGVFWEWTRLELSLGVLDRLELTSSARLAGWDEERDVFRVYTGGPLPSVRGEARMITDGVATGRHENIADWTLGAKVQLLRAGDGISGVATSVQAKLPISRPDDLTHAGTTDVAFTALGSLALGPVVLHGNAGVVLLLGEQTIFDDPREPLDTFGHFAAGVTYVATDWLALGASVETETSAWRRVDFLDHPAATASVAARAALGAFTIEVGAGTGLTSLSADAVAWVEVGARLEDLFGRDAPSAPPGEAVTR